MGAERSVLFGSWARGGIPWKFDEVFPLVLEALPCTPEEFGDCQGKVAL